MISGTGVAWFDAKKLEKLEKLYEEYHRPAPKDIIDKVKELL